MANLGWASSWEKTMRLRLAEAVQVAGLALVLLLGLGQTALAGRVALVIGNSAYEHAEPLPNPVNDAAAMAAALEEVGFEVVRGIDLDRQGTVRTLSDFAGRLAEAEVGLFFYAGHGMQVNGVNYIVPVDAALTREADVFLSLVSLEQVLQVMETEVPTRLVFLDACRDNPLARSLSRSLGATRSTAVGQGLARMDTAVGTLIAYSTAPGAVAEDGAGENSPFTAALLEHIGTPGLEARQVLSRVRQAVHQKTNGRQVPWDSSSLMGDFYFNVEIDITPPVSPELLFWDTIKGSDDPADFRSYLDRFGSEGTFADLASRRLAALTPAEEPAPVPEPVEPAVEAAPPALGRGDWRAAQTALDRLGFAPGGIDGLPGPRTYAALEAWQESAGIAAGTPLDPALLAQLRAAAAAVPEPEPPVAEETVAALPVPSRPEARSATPSPGSIISDCAHCPEQVVVPAGRFRMGSSPGDPGHESDEGPPLVVTIARPFSIGRYEVTRSQYRRFVEATGHVGQAGCWVWLVANFFDRNKDWRDNVSGPGGDLPVTCISVEDAMAYAAWLSAETGATWRLPSEAEFYWAASGGADTPYFWGTALEDACRYANVYDRSGRAAMPLSPWKSLSCDDGFGHLAPVGSFRPNAFGLYDMIGNAMQYTADCWAPTLAGHPADGSPRTLGADCSRAVLKGGSNWMAVDLATPLADRWRADRVDGGYEWTGFRLVRELE
jgi:formylglycine-generating enzyme required for sulfatase activity